MVTTIDGNAKRVTRKPLNAPHNPPVSSPTSTMAIAPPPAFLVSPIATEVSATMAATEMSISPATMTSVMASAINAFSL